VKLKNFDIDGESFPVEFKETSIIKKGVTCDVYSFESDETRDLGIITIQPGTKTPLQKVLNGTKTIEGYIAGKGQLAVTDVNGNKKIYQTNEASLKLEIKIGELMQWQADENSELKVYEMCYPPYEEGRFQNL